MGNKLYSTALNSKTSARFLLVVFIFILICTAAFWANYHFADQNPGGNDFLVHWVGLRSFVFKGQSPYSDQTALEIQAMVYGGPAEDGEHQLRVVYPLYSWIIFFPFSMFKSYVFARALWMTFLEIAIVSIGIISLRISGWKPERLLTVFYLLFSIFWYHGLRPLINGNAVIVVTLLILWAFLAIRTKRDVIAGFALALATIKPHLVIVLIVFIFLWAYSHQRWMLIGWTMGWFFLLVLLGIFFIPIWPLQNAWEILRFSEYNPTLTLGSAFGEWWPGIGTQLKWGMGIILIGLLLVEWIAARGKEYNHFMWTCCLTLAVNQWIGIATDPGNFIILFTPLVLVFSVIKERWQKAGNWIILGGMTLLFIGIWLLFLYTLEYGYQPQQSAVMFVPLPLVVILGLYWTKWWIIRPMRPTLS